MSVAAMTSWPGTFPNPTSGQIKKTLLSCPVDCKRPFDGRVQTEISSCLEWKDNQSGLAVAESCWALRDSDSAQIQEGVHSDEAVSLHVLVDLAVGEARCDTMRPSFCETFQFVLWLEMLILPYFAMILTERSLQKMVVSHNRKSCMAWIVCHQTHGISCWWTCSFCAPLGRRGKVVWLSSLRINVF